MPRLPPSLVRRAYNLDPNLARLLPTLRTIPAAATELRWLREHVAPVGANLTRRESSRLEDLSLRRGAGVPLQYLLGTEYFGPLELAVAPGVLIPRWETASSTMYLAERLMHKNMKWRGLPSLRVLDLCSGSGCIGLLLHHQLHLLSEGKITPHVRGVDLSPYALQLAKRNISCAVSFGLRESVNYVQGDVLAAQGAQALNWLEDSHGGGWDIVVANPPYISREAFMSSSTSRSVRNFEPRMALLPTETGVLGGDKVQADAFYPKLLEIASTVNAKVIMLEVADMQQAERVARLALEQMRSCDGMEIWRDEPSYSTEVTVANTSALSRDVVVHGAGNGRSVVCWQNGWL